MSEVYKFGSQLREFLRGLLQLEETVDLGNTRLLGYLGGGRDRFPEEGVDEIHPHTSMTVEVFGKGTETIEFPPDNVTLKIKRGQPFKARNGLTTIDTEMLELNLVGESKLLGPMRLRGGGQVATDPERLITGKIIEMEPGERFPAENFFDVFLEIETAQGVFFNKKPEHMTANITDIPPNFAKTPYRSTTEINLYSKDNPDGPPVGVIKAVAHRDAA